MKFVRNVHVSEEIMQEVFLRIYERGKNLDPDSTKTKNYLLSTAKNITLDYLRRYHNEQNKYGAKHFEELELSQSVFNDMENAIIHGEVISTLHDTLNSIPRVKREAFLSKVFLNKKNVEIIKEMNITRFILKRIIEEVREEIRMKLGKFFD